MHSLRTKPTNSDFTYSGGMTGTFSPLLSGEGDFSGGGGYYGNHVVEKHGFVTICNQKKAPIHSLWRSNWQVTKILIINVTKEKTE